MKLKRIFTPACLMLVLLVQFLPGTALFTSPVGATAINAGPAELAVSATDTTAYDFVANYCSATWTSGAGTLPCPGTDGAASGYVLNVASPQLENGTIDTAPGLVVAPQNVTGGYIQGVFPAYTVQAGDYFQSVVNCAYGASSCYVLFRLDYKIGSGAQQTFWHWKERNEGLFYRANLNLSSLAGQNVQFILYMSDMSGLGVPSGDRAMWGGAKIVHSSTTPAPAPVTGICDRGSFIADVTIPDGTTMVAGAPFTKTFRIRNVGSCTWTTSYAMVYVAGSLLGAPSTAINLSSSVASGQTSDFSINMVAPTTPGHYRSYWRFRNASGQQFGLGSGMVTFFADINVVSGSPTAITTITADNPDPSMPGQNVAVAVTVAGTGATPTGTVAITGADSNCTITLSAGTGSCNVVFNTLGSKTLTAAYSGNSTYVGSSATASHTVSNLTGSTTSITSEIPDPSVPGALVAVNVSVTGSGSTPTGTVAITGADTNCNITLSGGAGTCNVVFNSAGSKTITATYGGNSSYAGSVASTGHTVSTGTTSSTTTITSDIPDSSTPGQGVVVSVAVGGTGITPTGIVNITGADNNCSILLAGGTGSCSVVFTAVGSKTLTATYAGDANYSSSSGTASHTVSLGSTSTTITSETPDPSNPGQAVMVNFTVTGGGVNPTGTVSVTGADVNCTITLSGGSGGCNVVFNTTGTKTITATYSGDSNYSTSFNSTSHTVKLASTTTINSVIAEPSLPGSVVTITVTVTGAGTTPSGTVTVTGADVNCAAPIVLAGGTGNCTATYTTAGAKLLTATYSGDANYSPSSGTANHTVSKTDSTTTITGLIPPPPLPNPDTLPASHPYTSITISVNVAGAGVTPTGSVGISISGGQASSCTATLIAGSGSCNINITAVGSYTITAIYSGDGSHWSSSFTATQPIN